MDRLAINRNEPLAPQGLKMSLSNINNKNRIKSAHLARDIDDIYKKFKDLINQVKNRPSII